MSGSTNHYSGWPYSMLPVALGSQINRAIGYEAGRGSCRYGVVKKISSSICESLFTAETPQFVEITQRILYSQRSLCERYAFDVERFCKLGR
jgi:hypothetical protein